MESSDKIVTGPQSRNMERAAANIGLTVVDMDVPASLSCPNMHTSGSKHWPVSSAAFSARPACVYSVCCLF